MKRILPRLLVGTLFLAASLLRAAASDTKVEAKSISINGGAEDGKARLTIEANLLGNAASERVIHSTTIQHTLVITRDKHAHTVRAVFDILQGDPRELTLVLGGEGDIRSVTGAALQDWGVRQETNGVRVLVLRPKKSDKPVTQLVVEITADRSLTTWANPVKPLTFSSPQSSLAQGYLKIDVAADLAAEPVNPTGLVPIEPKFLPEILRSPSKADDLEPLAFRLQGGAYTIPLNITTTDPEARSVVVRDFKLEGDLAGGAASFTYSATIRVNNPRGASFTLLAGAVALNELDRHPDWRLRFVNGNFMAVFDKPGDYPVRLRFNAAVKPVNGWNSVDFRVASSPLQPVTLRGLAPDTQFAFGNAARPERSGSEFRSFLPPDGTVRLSWKESRPEAEGKLFYAAEMLAQVSVGAGLVRQNALIKGKVMQGELSRLVLTLSGVGNVTAVQGANVLSWKVEPVPQTQDRALVVQFNQPQKDTFSLQVQMQTELGALPQAVETMRLKPEGATRFAGHIRVVNEGAVRLEVVKSTGLSQVSPEQFPETAATKVWLGAKSGQRFAFRFSSTDFALRIQADNVLPELSVSQLLAYHLGETELAIDGEFELDIREAPLREVLLRIPKGFAIARVSASGLSDYFVREPADQPEAELRLVYGAPIADRQVIQLRLERNGALGRTNWSLPRVEVLKAKSTRGHIAVSADAGFRLTPDRTSGVGDIATAFFPRKVAGIQAAFRIADPNWEAALRVERLPQSIQADVFHLFSIGEGIAYGSSTMNFFISGAPVSQFLVSLSDEYFNVEFTGKDLRSNWQKTTNGYLVTMNTPVSGAYTLLASYERPFKAQGDTLTFTGARPVDAQNEQGHTLVVSAYQFQVKPSNVSSNLLELETAEVPAEYRLFFDAPILKAYRYASRPFNLQLTLSPLVQGATLSLVVDRAALTTRISKDGDVVTDARYFVKNRGNPHLKLTLPADTRLWSVTVNGATVVPVKDGASDLIPLPQRVDPNTVQTLDLKLATRSKNPARVTAAAPIVSAPVLLADWKLEPDAGQKLVYRSGSLAPVGGLPDVSGFAALARIFGHSGDAWFKLGLAGGVLLFGLWAWKWASGNGSHRFGVRHLGGAVVGAVGVLLAAVVLVDLAERASSERITMSDSITLLAPVQQGGSALTIEVANVANDANGDSFIGRAWPVILALCVWGYAFLGGRDDYKRLFVMLGWTCIAWAVLRLPNSSGTFFLLVALFLLVHLIVPAGRSVLNVPAAPPRNDDPASSATATTLSLLLMLGLTTFSGSVQAATAGSAKAPAEPPKSLRQVNGSSGTGSASPDGPGGSADATRRLGGSLRPTGVSSIRSREGAIADSVIQEVRIDEKFALVTAKIRWNAVQGQMLPILLDPGVLTKISFPSNSVRHVQTVLVGKRTHQLAALTDGQSEIELQYQLHIGQRGGESGFELATPHGLVNRISVTLPEMDVDVASTNAVSIQRSTSGTNTTVATLVLEPVTRSWISWKPRSRDVRQEKPVFYAEVFQLYAPVGGVIEGVHQVQIRPAQGELGELVFDVPAGATITDVVTPVPQESANRLGFIPNIVSLWRFDPDTRKLRVTLSPQQSKPFTLVVRSQVATGPLPFEQKAGLLGVVGAAGQLGSVGVATGSEVQLDNVTTESLSPINLEDFPASVLQPLRNQIAALTLRRAFRHADAKGTLTVKASAVEPDVRVETQETLSLGDDRSLLAVNAALTITRAGIFRVSFALPSGLDVESISGGSLSHWTELKSAEGRIITLHLKGRTEGQTQFSVNLAGPGTKSAKNVAVPRLAFREASKQRGQLVIVPEQGMRLQVAGRDGVTQLDPQKAGIRQKGVLAFRLLQPDWALALDVEQVDAWVQVTGLQHLTVTEAQLKATANLQYQIENTGLKALHLRVPANAEGVRFRGEQVADFLPVAGSITNGLQTWEVKLHRRIIGKYLLQATWQTPLAEASTNALAIGIQADEANLQRGFVTVQSSGRLQLRIGALPAALQPTEWQGIPRALLQDIPDTAANFTYRLVEPAFQLAMQLDRREATKLLPARVSSVKLTSVVSDDGVMLTQVRLDLIPGDKRLLSLSLPAEARFWFAFVNQNGVWPWRDQDKILIPLEQQSRADKPTTVEFFYSSHVGKGGSGSVNLALLGPKFDLPLENISWQVYLNDRWKVTKWAGSLQLQDNTRAVAPVSVDVQSYLANEMSLNKEKTKAAEQMLTLGNTLLERGDAGQARWAFQNAFGLSQHDNAFNEDARVQLHNLKLQQALIGLNVRQSAAGGEAAPTKGNLQQLRSQNTVAYTQQQAKQLIDANTADDNASLMKLAERIIQQQDAAVPAPAAIRASIPQQGRLLTFSRTVQVDTSADLDIRLTASVEKAASFGTRMGILFTVFAGFGLLVWVGGKLRRDAAVHA